jgi:hypothetical protein
MHFRKQDWIAIGLDFVIVVVGLFVGLQVDGWNEDRKERMRERTSLEQLYVDFGEANKLLQQIAEFHASKIPELEFAIDAIVKQELADDERQRFMFAILSMYQLPPHGATMGAYDAMLASGDFGLLQDQKLKSMLVKLDADMDAESSLLDYFRQFSMNNLEITRGIVSVARNSDRTDTTYALDFELATSNPQVLSVISDQHRSQGLFSAGRQDLADEFLEAQTYIGKLLGYDVVPVENEAVSN